MAEYLASPPDEAEQPGPGAEYVNRTGFRFTRLFTSAMRRSLQTAAPIGQAIGLQPEVWVDIHEIGGVFLDDHEGRGLPGLKRAEMAAQFPTIRLSAEVTEEGWWNRGRETEGWSGRARAAERAARVAEGGSLPCCALDTTILSHRNTAITRRLLDDGTTYMPATG